MALPRVLAALLLVALTGAGPAAAASQNEVVAEPRIHAIQGAAHRSPLEGALVAGVPGVVTAVRLNGFYLQDPEPDGSDATSEGILVFTGGTPTVEVGQSVLVGGRVTEFRPGGAAGAANLTTTEITAPTVTPVGTGAMAPTTVGLGGRVPPLAVIDDDAVGGDVEAPATPFDPARDGIDFHESLEGMLVQVRNAVAVGPTSDFGELPVLGDLGFLAFPRTARGGLYLRPNDFNPERLMLDDALAGPMPAADVRDRLGTVRAVVDYSFGNFKYQVLAPPVRRDGGLAPETSTAGPRGNRLSVASLNVENLDGLDPQAQYDRIAGIVVDALRNPDLLALEEIQDDDGAATGSPAGATATWQRLIAAIAAAGGPAYDFRQIDPAPGQDGGEPGGNIRVGFLFRADRGLAFVDRTGGTATTATADDPARPGAQLTFSPGRIAPTDPAFANSRKPLAGEFTWRGRTFFAVANHFNSKGGDDPLFGRRQPPQRPTEVQRHQQATVVRDFVRGLVVADPDAAVIVLGDFNDFEFSRTLEILEDGGLLANLMETLPRWERYSYVFEGNSQTLDQILVTRSLARRGPAYDSVHVNAEFADQASDHDPQAARLRVRR